MINFINKNHSKSLILVISILLISVFTCIPIFAKNHVDNIEIDVAIHNNGSATITQRWSGSFDEGTEVYLPIEDKSLIVKNLKVWKGNREYLPADGWNVNWSFESKKWRSGINYTDSGLELCFGISEYGNNIYTFSYDVDPLVKSYTDSDGFNFQFVNPGMSIFPSNVNLRIRFDDDKKLSTDNARIWGFGYNGMAQFSEDGYAIAYSTSPLSGDNYMNVTLEIFKGLISPNVSVSDTFENVILNAALEGSGYKEVLEQERKRGLDPAFLFALFFWGVVIISFVVKIVLKIIRKYKLKKFYKEGNYFRDVPNGGDIAVTNALYADFSLWSNKETNIIGAIIMKMINNGNLTPVQDKSYGLFGKEKVSTSLKIGKEPKDPILKELFDIIIRAAGDDNILQENEMKNYAKENYKPLIQYVENLKTKSKTSLNKLDIYNRLLGKNLDDLNEKGKKELAEVYGLRKFLDEFTLIKERSITEGVIWEDLMVYATLFGIAEKVLSQLKKVYPDKLVRINELSNTYYVSDVYFRSLYYSSINTRRAVNAMKMASMAAKGLGGVASLGGGGGFSGGGHGGGTR